MSYRARLLLRPLREGKQMCKRQSRHPPVWLTPRPDVPGLGRDGSSMVLAFVGVRGNSPMELLIRLECVRHGIFAHLLASTVLFAAAFSVRSVARRT